MRSPLSALGLVAGYSCGQPHHEHGAALRSESAAAALRAGLPRRRALWQLSPRRAPVISPYQCHPSRRASHIQASFWKPACVGIAAPGRALANFQKPSCCNASRCTRCRLRPGPCSWKIAPPSCARGPIPPKQLGCVPLACPPASSSPAVAARASGVEGFCSR
jgi:hypothetical protein